MDVSAFCIRKDISLSFFGYTGTSIHWPMRTQMLDRNFPDEHTAKASCERTYEARVGQ